MTPRHDADLERELSLALRTEAERFVPGDRLEEILGSAHAPDLAEVRPLHSRRIVLAAAAAAVVVVGGFWTLTNRPATEVVGNPPASRTAPTAGVPSHTPTTAPTGALPAHPVSVPVYAVGSERVGGPVALVRTFGRVLLIGPSAEAAFQTRVSGALEASTAQSGAAHLATSAVSVLRAVDGDTIEVSFASAPRAASAADAHRVLAAWLRTVQGVAGRGDVPVRFSMADGTSLLGQLSSTRVVRQADVADVAFASIWVDGPVGTVTPTKAVTASGIASVFESRLGWELTRDGARVGGGSTMAAAGAPARAAWSIGLGTLAPGSYELRVYALSAKDGSVAAERTSDFVVGG